MIRRLTFAAALSGAIGLVATGCSTGTTDPATNVTTSAATLNATINPDGDSYRYRFEWRRASASTMTVTPWRSVSNPGTAGRRVSDQITGLAANTRYAFRVCGEETTGSRPIGKADRVTYTCGALRDFTTTPITSTGACAAQGRNVRDGIDPWGGCFPGPANTGVPAGTALANYTGPCTITAANTVIDSKTVNCGLNVNAGGVAIRRSRVNGSITTSAQGSLTITDSTVDAGDVNSTVNNGPRALNGQNFTAIRVETVRGISGGWCNSKCEVRDSWIHGQDRDEGGHAHASGFRQGSGSGQRFIHNTVVCDAPTVAPEAGCSADITGYGDFDYVRNNTLERNLLEWTPQGGFCAYGGSTPSKPFSAGSNNVWRDNIFQRGPSGKCGVYGAMTDLAAAVRGNQWINNRWDTGEQMP
jgi:hypothetical protein